MTKMDFLFRGGCQWGAESERKKEKGKEWMEVRLEYAQASD